MFQEAVIEGGGVAGASLTFYPRIMSLVCTVGHPVSQQEKHVVTGDRW